MVDTNTFGGCPAGILFGASVYLHGRRDFANRLDKFPFKATKILIYKNANDLILHAILSNSLVASPSLPVIPFADVSGRLIDALSLSGGMKGKHEWPSSKAHLRYQER